MMLPLPYRPIALPPLVLGRLFFNRAIYASRRAKTLKCGILYRFCSILRRSLLPHPSAWWNAALPRFYPCEQGLRDPAGDGREEEGAGQADEVFAKMIAALLREHNALL